MSRERATAAPTGLKSFLTTQNYRTSVYYFAFIGAFLAGTNFVLQALRQLGLNLFLLLKITELLFTTLPSLARS